MSASDKTVRHHSPCSYLVPAYSAEVSSSCLQEAFLGSSEKGGSLTPTHTWPRHCFCPGRAFLLIYTLMSVLSLMASSWGWGWSHMDPTHPHCQGHNHDPSHSHAVSCSVSYSSPLDDTQRQDHCHFHMACPTYSVTHSHFTVSTVAHITEYHRATHSGTITILLLRMAHPQCHIAIMFLMLHKVPLM